MSATEIEGSVSARLNAIELVKKFGVWKSAGPVKLLLFERGSIAIGYRTPFQKLPAESETIRYMRTALGGKPNLPYGLDVWYSRKKVLNVEWDDKGSKDLVTYRPGAWESDIRRLLEAG